MEIRTLQWKFKDFDDTYVDFQWSTITAAYYRQCVRRAYRYARENGAEKHTARHLVIDLLLIGKAAN